MTTAKVFCGGAAASPRRAVPAPGEFAAVTGAEVCGAGWPGAGRSLRRLRPRRKYLGGRNQPHEKSSKSICWALPRGYQNRFRSVERSVRARNVAEQRFGVIEEQPLRFKSMHREILRFAQNAKLLFPQPVRSHLTDYLCGSRFYSPRKKAPPSRHSERSEESLLIAAWMQRDSSLLSDNTIFLTTYLWLRSIVWKAPSSQFSASLGEEAREEAEHQIGNQIATRVQSLSMLNNILRWISYVLAVLALAAGMALLIGDAKPWTLPGLPAAAISAAPLLLVGASFLILQPILRPRSDGIAEKRASRGDILALGGDSTHAAECHVGAAGQCRDRAVRSGPGLGDSGLEDFIEEKLIPAIFSCGPADTARNSNARSIRRRSTAFPRPPFPS